MIKLNSNHDAWAYHTLQSKGYTLKSNQAEEIVHTFYSRVVRFDTTSGYIYLKETPKELAEDKIIETLKSEYQGPVAEIIASHESAPCFLMKDAGPSLRSIFKNKFDLNLASKAIECFSQLQLKVSQNLSPLQKLNIPVWCLDKLPDALHDTLMDQELYKATGIPDSLRKNVLSKCSKIQELCQQLNQYNIEPSFVHPDCNDNNLLYNTTTQEITIIDLGEIVISHPFFSWINYFFQLEKHHGISNPSKQYTTLYTAAIKAFTPNEDIYTLNEIFQKITKLWPVYSILSWYRLVKCTRSPLIIKTQGPKLSAVMTMIEKNIH